MTLRILVGAAALTVGMSSGASALNLQPGMLTMMQQGGTEHGVQSGCELPGYDPIHTCADSRYGGYARGGVDRRPAPFRRLSR